MFRRHFILLYALGAYILAFANLLYVLAFLADRIVPKGINDGIQGEVWIAVAVDLGLIWLFGLHHSLTARTWFKKYWTRIIPPAIERATYLYMTAIVTGLLIYFWRPIPISVWEVEDTVVVGGILGLYLAVWGAMLCATFQFGHFGFFGLKQAWEQFVKKPPAEASFSAKWFYGMVRHPISLCWMLTPWVTPHLTVGSIVFALGITVYILIATPFEEADLTSELGNTYHRYKETVPAFIPFIGKNRKSLQT